ncbi:HSP20-like chaperone [Trichoderma citrinoviride]|uniref:HSP20-like chaperone n=1 Tax=Trichoderma citrinoviride TaxID=58853 RepID=A0A2T4BL14_9HYPO|nr:HSP20-like chaperone [Trichoderma citrinoviride]PTB70014.1 HSP20-like chaperone [Trichoderma citrinoviride]
MAETLTPEVLWAQRSSVSDASKNFIYLTISVPDVPKEDLKLDLKPTSVTFTGTSATLKKTYHVELELYAEIDPAESRVNHTAKNIEMKLQKKELKEEYWPRLLKSSQKLHFLKTDFDKWVDEDEQNEAADDDLSKFGDMGGMPGMGGDFGGIDFSKLGGGAGGMPDMSGMGLEGMPEYSSSGNPDSSDDDDDDEMPGLEGEEEKKAEEEKKDEGEAAPKA